MQIASRPSPCMSRKFASGKLASRSCWAARGASTRRPKRRAASISAASLGGKRNAAGSKIGASVSIDARSRSCMDLPLHGVVLERTAKEVETSGIEGGRRLQVRKMPNAGQAMIEGAGYLAGHALHHLGRGSAIVGTGETEHGYFYGGQVGALIEADEAADRGTIGVGVDGAHRRDGKRAALGIGCRADKTADQSWRQLRERPPLVQGFEAAHHEPALEVTRGIAEGRAGGAQNGRTVGLRPPSQAGLGHHAAERVAEEHGPVEAVPFDGSLHVGGERLEVHDRGGGAGAIARQVEGQRRKTRRGKGAELRRPYPGGAADPVEEDHCGPRRPRHDTSKGRAARLARGRQSIGELGGKQTSILKFHA